MMYPYMILADDKENRWQQSLRTGVYPILVFAALL